jgi:hypothetical protein
MIGDVFTSERAMALLLRWHIRDPGRLIEHVAGVGQRASATLPTRYAQAGVPAGAGDPSQWMHDHEAALVASITDWPTRPDAPSEELRDTMEYVHNWPHWAGGPNPRKYQRSAAVGRLEIARISFDFDAIWLPATPDYMVISP